MINRNIQFLRQRVAFAVHHHHAHGLRRRGFSSSSLVRKEEEPAVGKEVLSPLFSAAIKDAQASQLKKSNALVGKEEKNDMSQGAAKIPLPSQLIFTTGNMNVSQKKLNHLARLIQGMSLAKARIQMDHVMKRRGKEVASMLHRAGCALEHNWGEEKEDYIISQAWIGKGVFLKRIRIHGRGRTGKMTRPRAHLKVLLTKKKVYTAAARDSASFITNANAAAAASIDGSSPVSQAVSSLTLEKIAEKELEFQKLRKMFKRDRLFVTIQDKRLIYPINAPWSTKGWKYITNKRWVSPDNALMRYAKPPRSS